MGALQNPYFQAWVQSYFDLKYLGRGTMMGVVYYNTSLCRYSLDKYMWQNFQSKLWKLFAYLVSKKCDIQKRQIHEKRQTEKQWRLKFEFI